MVKKKDGSLRLVWITDDSMRCQKQMHTPCLALMISTLISQEVTGKYQLPSKRVQKLPYNTIWAVPIQLNALWVTGSSSNFPEVDG